VPRSVPEVTCTTNIFVVEGEAEPVVIVDCVTNLVTDSISFVGKVKPGKRLNLLLSTPQGKMTYKGVPLTETADLSGFWTGSKKETNQTQIEFFALSPIMANAYFMDGIGAGYSYTDGLCLVSSQKRIGFSVVEIPNGETNGLLRATVGSINKVGTKAKTKGIKEPEKFVTFDASPQPVP
jgi:hypothetical protein